MKIYFVLLLVFSCLVVAYSERFERGINEIKTDIKSLDKKGNDTNTSQNEDDDDDDVDENDKIELDDVDDEDLNNDFKESQQEFNKLVEMQVNLKQQIATLKTTMGITAPAATLEDVLDEVEKQYPKADFDVNENNGNTTVSVTMDNNAPVPPKLKRAVDILNGAITTTKQIKQQVQYTEQVIRKLTARNESRLIMTLVPGNSTINARQNMVKVRRAGNLVNLVQKNVLTIDQDLTSGLQKLVSHTTTGGGSGVASTKAIFEYIITSVAMWMTVKSCLVGF